MRQNGENWGDKGKNRSYNGKTEGNNGKNLGDKGVSDISQLFGGRKIAIRRGQKWLLMRADGHQIKQTPV